MGDGDGSWIMDHGSKCLPSMPPPRPAQQGTVCKCLWLAEVSWIQVDDDDDDDDDDDAGDDGDH
eukprot:6428903-Karenia_brevis.AAC.1